MAERMANCHVTIDEAWPVLVVGDPARGEDTQLPVELLEAWVAAERALHSAEADILRYLRVTGNQPVLRDLKPLAEARESQGLL